MANIFWGDVGTAGGAISDANLYSYTDATAGGIVRTELSREMWKVTWVEANFRRYVDKITGFGRNMSDKFMIPKDLLRPEDQVWSEVGEFDPLPQANLQFGRYLIKVTERGKSFPLTERANLFSFVDLESYIPEKLSQIAVASIERDLLMNGFLYLDIVGVCSTGGSVQVSTGKSLGPQKTFDRDVDGIFTSITVSQVTYNTTAHTIEDVAPQALTMAHIMAFAKALYDNNVPSYTGSGFGNYLIILNKQAENRLLTDPVFYNAVSYSGDVEKLYRGYIGSFYGQEFVRDESKFIEKFICTLNPELNGKAIAIFLGKGPVVEAIVQPEVVREGTPIDFGRYRAFGVNTYRGEQPTWLAAANEGQASGGILVGL